MEAWRFRIMVAMALVILIFGDFLGYGNGGERKIQVSRQSPTMRDDQPSIFLDDEESASEFLSMATTDESGAVTRKIIKLTPEVRDACLPKMLCEIATKPQPEMSDKERNLMELIRSTTLSLTGVHTKWHFAAHMGMLMRHTPESGGCAMLWPSCPYSTKRLNELGARISLNH